jgi:hypothetical protein
MRRLITFLALLAALGGLCAPARAFPLGQRAPVLTSGPCANVTVKIDFVSGRYCLGGATGPGLSSLSAATFTRASAKTCITSAGVVISVASGVPCITDQGWLPEGAATNNALTPRASSAVVAPGPSTIRQRSSTTR